MSKEKVNLREQLTKAFEQLIKLKPYAFIGLFVLIAGLYGFLVLRINTLSNEQPTSDAINSQLSNVKVPRLDTSVIKQLQSLQDNSVSVKTLFNDARNNPFQE